MLYIDQFVYSNKMRFSHPGERILFAVITMIISVAVNRPLVHLFIIGIMVGLLIYRAKIPLGVITKLFSIPITFLILGVITIAIVISENKSGMLLSFTLGKFFLGVTEASLALAGMTMLKSLSAVSCLYFLVLTTPMIEVINMLRFVKMPKVLIELMMLIYRFIFVFIETAFNIYTSQSSRWGYCNFKRSVYSFGLLFASLWTKTFLKSQSLFTSLVSRGYEGELKVLNPSYQVCLKNLLFFILIDLGLIVIALI